jgi:hypothetical protein
MAGVLPHADAPQIVPDVEKLEEKVDVVHPDPGTGPLVSNGGEQSCSSAISASSTGFICTTHRQKQTHSMTRDNSTLLFNILCIYKVSLGHEHKRAMNTKCKPRCAVV